MPKIFKNVYLRLAFISIIATLSLLIALPEIPIRIQNRLISIDSSIGGYNFQIFDGRIGVDLTGLKKGLDLAGGMRVVFRVHMQETPENDREKVLESVKEIIEKRIKFFGVSEPYIATSKVDDEYNIVVEMSNVSDITSALQLIAQTARLNLKELAPDTEWDESKFQEYFADSSVWVETSVTGSDLRGTEIVFPQGQFSLSQNDNPKIQLHFSGDGRKKFEEVAKANIGKPVALYLDDDPYPLSIAVVGEEFAQGMINDPVMNGNFNEKTAKALSVYLRAGSLPVPVEVAEQTQMEAILGAKSIQKSSLALIIGFMLLVLFMIFMYGRLGIFSGFVLLIHALVVISIFKLVPITLTLSGVVGFVLSVVMLVDASISILERIKEEQYWGRPKNLAIKMGFERAWQSIKDSNIALLLISIVLFYFGAEPINDFALALVIGILILSFNVLFVVKTLLEVLNFGVYREPKARGLVRIPKFKFRR